MIWLTNNSYAAGEWDDYVGTFGSGKEFSGLDTAVASLITTQGATPFTHEIQIVGYTGDYDNLTVVVDTLVPTASYKLVITAASEQTPMLSSDNPSNAALDLRVDYVVVRHLSFEDSGYAIYVYGDNVLVDGNSLYGDSRYGIFLNDACDTSLVINNFLCGFSQSGIRTALFNEIYNNTIILNNAQISEVTCRGIDEQTRRGTYKNNCIYIGAAPTGATVCGIRLGFTGDYLGGGCDYNNYYIGENGPGAEYIAYLPPAGYYASFAAFVADTTSSNIGVHDSHSNNGNPKLANVTLGSESYTLETDSYLVDVGVDLTAEGFTTDITGETRPIGDAWEIGCNEQEVSPWMDYVGTFGTDMEFSGLDTAVASLISEQGATPFTHEIQIVGLAGTYSNVNVTINTLVPTTDYRLVLTTSGGAVSLDDDGTEGHHILNLDVDYLTLSGFALQSDTENTNMVVFTGQSDYFILSDCTFTGTEPTAWAVWITTLGEDSVIDSCYFDSVGGTIYCDAAANNSEITIMNNRAVIDGASSGSYFCNFYDFHHNNTTSHVYIYNNSVLVRIDLNQDNRSDSGIIVSSYESMDPDEDVPVTVKNNAFYIDGDSAGNYFCFINDSNGDLNEWDTDYNVGYTTPPYAQTWKLNGWARYRGTYYRTLIEYQIGEEGGEHSIEADPLFTEMDDGEEDFHMSSTASPCHNTGATLAAVTADFEDDPRPLSVIYDVGADEEFLNTAPSVENVVATLTGKHEATKVRVDYTLTDTDFDWCNYTTAATQIQYSADGFVYHDATISGTTTGATASPGGAAHTAENEPLYWDAYTDVGDILSPGSLYSVRIKPHDGTEFAASYASSGTLYVFTNTKPVGTIGDLAINLAQETYAVTVSITDADDDLCSIQGVNGQYREGEGGDWTDAVLTGNTGLAPGDHLMTWFYALNNLGDGAAHVLYFRIRPNDGYINADSYSTSSVFVLPGTGRRKDDGLFPGNMNLQETSGGGIK